MLFSTMRKCYFLAGFSDVFLVFFLQERKRSCRKQTTAMSSLKNKKIRAKIVSLPKPLFSRVKPAPEISRVENKAN